MDLVAVQSWVESEVCWIHALATVGMKSPAHTYLVMAGATLMAVMSFCCWCPVSMRLYRMGCLCGARNLGLRLLLLLIKFCMFCNKFTRCPWAVQEEWSYWILRLYSIQCSSSLNFQCGMAKKSQMGKSMRNLSQFIEAY